MTNTDTNVPRGLPPDPHTASGRAHRLPRAGVTHTRGSLQLPRTGVRHARGNEQVPINNLRIASLNVGTMKGRSLEVVETLERRSIDICCVQETRWRGGSARVLVGKEAKYKFHWSGNDAGT